MPRMLDPNISFVGARRHRDQRRALRHGDRHADKHRTANKSKTFRMTAPFCGVDGEGGGTRKNGVQKYLLLRAGEFYLFNKNKDLTTKECLSFLAHLPPNRQYVAFYFDYDVTMILRDVEPELRDQILCKADGTDFSRRRATYVFGFEVEYVPRKYFKVRVADPPEHQCSYLPAYRRGSTNRPWITINEVGPFFQCSFVKAITDWECGTSEQRVLIAENKARRNDFGEMTDIEISYNKTECDLLEELMTKFRAVCDDTGYIPARWQGPGYLASQMFRQQGIPKRQEYGLDPELQSYANAAYYGGRFELLKIGTVEQVHEYDINSAYPYAMLHLPCLMHGSWDHHKGKPNNLDDLFVADVTFDHPTAVAICHLPIRHAKTGTISWPRSGRGWYWSTEINAALATGTLKIKQWHDHWKYKKCCDCHPFEWLKDVYAIRKAIGKGTKGYALKLAINSLYGKTAQSIGTSPYANPIWAGLITAHTRSMLINAYAKIDSRAIVMLATDGIYTTTDLDLPIGGELGQWEHKLHDEMFLVQPGIYFSSAAKARPKTRGVSMAIVLQYENEFRRAFEEWLHHGVADILGYIGTFPSVTMPIRAFIGLKLAQAWNKPDEAGKWCDTTKTISFDFRSKRMPGLIADRCIHTVPITPSTLVQTKPYARDIGNWRGSHVPASMPWDQDVRESAALAISQPDLFLFSPLQDE